MVPLFSDDFSLTKERHPITSSQQTLGELASSFELYGLCTQCNRMPQLDIAQLIQVFGPQTSIDSIRKRLVCNRCGHRTKNIRVVYRGPAGGAAAFRYLGSGSSQHSSQHSSQEENDQKAQPSSSSVASSVKPKPSTPT